MAYHQKRVPQKTQTFVDDDSCLMVVALSITGRNDKKSQYFMPPKDVCKHEAEKNLKTAREGRTPVRPPCKCTAYQTCFRATSVSMDVYALHIIAGGRGALQCDRGIADAACQGMFSRHDCANNCLRGCANGRSGERPSRAAAMIFVAACQGMFSRNDCVNGCLRGCA